MSSMFRPFNPFARTHVDDFPDVLIPLDQAIRHYTIRVMEKRARNPSFATETEMSDSSPVRSGLDLASVDPGASLTVQILRAEVDEVIKKGISGHDTMYDRKAIVINKAIQDIGMGKYQWRAFVLTGFGWFADQLWLQGIATSLIGIGDEFHKDDINVRHATLSLFLGLCIGASFWGIASDVIGRKLAFNFTLLIAGAFGIAAGFAPNWIGTCALFSCIGVGVGGNLPVDGALFLEFLPMVSGSLLTLLSVWWPIGQLVASLISWRFMVTLGDHGGWRYTIITCGVLTVVMFVCRVFLFQFFETPKFLLSRGRQAEAVAVIHGIAYINGTKTWLSEEVLNDVGGYSESEPDSTLSIPAIVKHGLADFSIERIGPLFKQARLGVNTTLLWFIWAAIGMGYPLFNAFLPQYFDKAGDQQISTDVQYRNYVIASVVGVPGSIIACFIVNIRHLGRKGTMAISTILCGIFLMLFAVSYTPGKQLAMASLEAFFQNITYGVLFAYTPEVFPAPNRGTGTGISSFLNRVAGLSAPLVAINAGRLNRDAPIFASAALFFAASFAMVLLPIETLGRHSL